jgi:prefoldin subunit 5
MSNVVQEIQMLRDDIEELRRRLDKIELYILVITKHLARADPERDDEAA